MTQLETEILVLGGGPSGIMAAKTAAHEGYKVTLLERNGYLGGSATMSLVIPLMTFHAGEKQVVKGYAQELLDRMGKYNGYIGHMEDPLGFGSSITPIETEVYKYVAQEFLLEEDVNILLHTELIDVKMKNDDIVSVLVRTRSGEYEISAQYYVDASGDGDLSYLSNNPMKIGRKQDGKVQPMTMMFKVGNVDTEKLLDYVDENPKEFVINEQYNSLREAKRIGISGFFSLVEDAKKKGDLSFDRDRVLFFELIQPGEIAVNMSRIINKNAVKGFELSESSIEGRRQVFEIIRFFKKYLPGFEKARLLETAPQVGVRESRRIEGLYVLTEEDLVHERRFDDVIALGSWPIDIHDPEGKELIVTQMREGSYYDIPYRSLVPKKSKNLIATGRIISATHEALASTRVSPTCMALGQAAGMAAAMAFESKTSFDQIDIQKLQKKLIRTGQVLE